jgi:2-polyprenyl-3-methyl-5-hydroxy-6-metoxy-1,4-benzoquinol methylase
LKIDINIKMGYNFWKDDAELYNRVGFEINEYGTHPEIIKLFNKYSMNARLILDYGCGNGSLIQKLNKRELDISLFDISQKMLDLAQENIKEYNPNIFTNSRDLPEKYFDCVFLSMVLVCVQDVEEFNFIAERIKAVKNRDGFVYVANPHPCFRDDLFSSYYTEYSTKEKEFNYFKEGDRHKVIIRENNLTFTDYNWPISSIINTFLSYGFKLIEMKELKDNETTKFYNEKASPSIIYVFK